jgi:hypothetical protein
MPMWLINSYIEMLPRLQAEESLLEVARIGIGTGSMEKQMRSKIHRQWVRDAQSARERHLITPEQFRAKMSFVGIPVVME